MKIAEVRELKTAELLERIAAESTALTQKEINHSISPLDNPSEITKARKNIARLKTVARERELNSK
ncbi:50S ribosomal protein L29 [Bacteroidales bacterium]|nr:50S ribosomal protein L29 [Bacteroidales bacterium]